MFDLGTRRIVRRADAELAGEPERFLELPLVTDGALQMLAREFVDAHQLTLDLEAIVALADWYAALVRSCDDLHLLGAWKSARAEHVRTVALAWAASHGISEDNLLQPPHRRGRAISEPRASRPRLGDAQDDETDGVREFLHAAIERMTLQEMEDLRLPLRIVMRTRNFGGRTG